MEMRNHRLGLVSAILCFLSCFTSALAADVMWHQDGLRAVGSSNKELDTLRDLHLSEPDNIPRNSVRLQDDELWRSTSLPDCKRKSTLCQSILQRCHSRVLKWLTSVRSKHLRRSMTEISPNSAPTPPHHSHHRSAGVRWGVGLALGAVSGAVVAAFAAVLLRFILSYRKRASCYRNPIIFNKNITIQMLDFLHKDDALVGAKLVGEGGSSKVYRVPLDSKIVVAIKSVPRLHPQRHDQVAASEETIRAPNQDAKGILAELDTLGYIRHRNLVQLWAYIYKLDSHLLIYEYMPRGSLQDAFRLMSAGELTLTWPQRHRIMCGVAQGLAYLHNSHGGCIVHRDLKPGNILLTDDLEAKLADFGLAAILPDKATHASTDALAGTIGYIAPEFHQTLRYSQKADIYSFGVVLAQMATAREPTDSMFIENGGSIGAWLQRCLNSHDDSIAAIDPALRETDYRDEILLAMKVAVFCMSVDPQLRPLSNNVLTMLLQIRNPEPARSDGGSGPSDVMASASEAEGTTLQERDEA